MKRLLMSAGAVVALMLLLGAPAVYAVSTLHVDASTGVDSGSCGSQAAPCQTISQAVANASPGDTIVVAAGTYGESVVIDKSLTLQGAQAGNAGSAARASESPATESVLTGGNIDIESSDVTVDGFSFAFAGNQVCVACLALSSSSGVTIEDNEFSGYQPNNFGPFQVTAAIGVNHAADTEISRNYFTTSGADFSAGGAVVQWFNGGCSGAAVNDNVFDSAEQGALADVYFYCDSESADPTSTITVSGNQDTITGNSDFALFTHIGGGAEVGIADNTVSMSPASSSGIFFSTDPGLDTIHISGNTLTGSPFRGVKLTGNAQIPGSVAITGNDFSGNGVGVYVGVNALASGNVVLRGNDLSGENGDTAGDGPDGVFDDASSGGAVDAADNWWGCNAGPGQTGCSNAVGVTPGTWLVLGVSASPGSLFDGALSTVTADLTRDNTGADTSGSGTILDGTSIGFSTDAGTVSSSSAATSGGKASVALRSTSAGTAHVTATFGGQSASAAVTYTAQTASAALSTLAPPSSTLAANGSSTQVLTVQARDAHGADLSVGGDTVAITKLSGTGSIGSVTDHGDGTYTATVTAPSSPGTGVFVATVNGQPVKAGAATQSQATIRFVGQPTISGFDPGSGGARATVTVTGTNFTGTTLVRLNGTSAVFAVASDTKLTFTVPVGATSGTIVITNPAGSATSTGTFTVDSQPAITSISPGTGPIGTTVTITGTHLTGTVGVRIGSIVTVPLSVSDTQVTFTIPPGAATGTLTILSRAGSATSPGTFTVTG